MSCTCGGSRHRFDPKLLRWVACECLLVKRTESTYLAAGGPVRYVGVEWRDFLRDHEIDPKPAALVGHARELAKGTVPLKWLMVYARQAEARTLVAALLLRAACQGGLGAKILDLPTLIDHEFKEGRGSDLYDLPVLIVEIGQEPPNKWNRIIMEKLVRQRWGHGRFNVFLTGQDPARLAALYKSAVVGDAFSQYCARVSCASKEGEQHA